MPGNLHILPGIMVTKVIFNGTRAIGVQTEHTTCTCHPSLLLNHHLTDIPPVHSTHAPILRASAIDTPKLLLLLLSGIGDRSELASHNITPLIHLLGVGKSLQDHPMFILDCEMRDTFHSRRTTTTPSALAAACAEYV